MSGILIGTASSVADLLGQLKDFALSGSTAWQLDYFNASTGRLFLHENNGAESIYPSFRWDTSTPQYLGLFSARGFINSATDPGQQTDDSGQGYYGVSPGLNANLATGLNVKLVNSSMPFWFFKQFGSGECIHVVAQTAIDTVVHFGFGKILRLGDNWTGGEYVYGSHYNATGASSSAIAPESSFLLDGLADKSSGGADGLGGSPFRAVMHVEGIPNQAASKWGVVGNFATTAPGSDRGIGHGALTRTKLLGGFRGGGATRGLGRWGPATISGNVNLLPVSVAALTNSDADLRLLGMVPGVFQVNMQFFELGNKITIGGFDYYLFPTMKKSGNNVSGTTYWQGIAYAPTLLA